MSSELRKEPFTNDFGQVIKPGDEVMYAGTNTYTTYFRKGIFEGVYYADSYYSSGNKKMLWAVKVSGVKDRRWDRKERKMVDFERTACLPLKRVFKLETSVKDLADNSVRI